MLTNPRLMHLKLIQNKQCKKNKEKTEATGNLISNIIANKITQVLITSPQNRSKTVTNKAENIKNDIKRPRESYISAEQ